MLWLTLLAVPLGVLGGTWVGLRIVGVQLTLGQFLATVDPTGWALLVVLVALCGLFVSLCRW